MLAAVVASLDRFEVMTPALHAMGQRHTSYGVLSRHYEIVEHGFLWALRQVLAMSSDSEELAAWRTLVRQVSAVMKAGAEQLNTPDVAQSDERLMDGSR